MGSRRRDHPPVCVEPRQLDLSGVARALLLGAVLWSAGCHNTDVEHVSQQIVRLTAMPGNHGLTQALVHEYQRAFPDVEFLLFEASGSINAVEAMLRGDADLGFSSAGVAYFVSVRRETRSDGSSPLLRGIAVLQSVPLRLFVRADSGIRRLDDLRGRRVGIGLQGSSVRFTSEIVLRAFGIDLETLQAESLRSDQAAERLLAGSLDAMFVGSAPAVVKAVVQGGASLLPIEGPPVDRLRREYPFLKLASIPGRVHADRGDPIRTVAFDAVLVCRDNLDEQLAYDLTRHFFEALPSLVSVEGSLSGMDLSQAPATPIPLHVGAARYYRELELFQ